MKFQHLFICIIFALGVAAGAAAQPSVRWTATTHNFGAFDEDNGPVSCDFTFVNTGTEAVSIIAARASCGCTAPLYSAGTVAPGDSGTITVTYDPSGRPGRFDKFVAVDLSYPDSRVKLHIVGTVIGSTGSVSQRFPAECAGGLRLSKGAVMFGDVNKNSMRTTFLTGYNSGHDTISLSATALPPFVDVTFEPALVPPGEQTSAVMFFKSDHTPLYGLVTDSVRIVVDGNDGCTVPVMAFVREDFTRLSPGELAKAPVALLGSSTLDFGTLSRSGAPVSRTVEITNGGKRTLEVRRVYTTDSGVSAAINTKSIKKGHSATITVTVDPAALPGALLNARISIITNDPSNANLTLRAGGELR